ncbi:MAG: hypothetical protein M1819_001322 [Sarea resinae]|nr:MAG: hypothetical protein M1819_001322 [Sarea resinae]
MADAPSDLIWELTRPYNTYLVKRRTGGGAQFSRDPLNLVNKHSRKYSGFVNDKAVGVQSSEKNGVTVITKRTKNVNKPASGFNETTFSASTPSRKLYKIVANTTAKNGYRSDLRAEAVARASALRQSQRPKKETPEKKLRGVKAKKAAEKDSA